MALISRIYKSTNKNVCKNSITSSKKKFHDKARNLIVMIYFAYSQIIYNRFKINCGLV